MVKKGSTLWSKSSTCNTCAHYTHVLPVLSICIAGVLDMLWITHVMHQNTTHILHMYHTMVNAYGTLSFQLVFMNIVPAPSTPPNISTMYVFDTSEFVLVIKKPYSYQNSSKVCYMFDSLAFSKYILCKQYDTWIISIKSWYSFWYLVTVLSVCEH